MQDIRALQEIARRIEEIEAPQERPQHGGVEAERGDEAARQDVAHVGARVHGVSGLGRRRVVGLPFALALRSRRSFPVLGDRERVPGNDLAFDARLHFEGERAHIVSVLGDRVD